MERDYANVFGPPARSPVGAHRRRPAKERDKAAQRRFLVNDRRRRPQSGDVKSRFLAESGV